MISFNDLTYHLDLDKKIYVGYSGGPDSTALLHLLCSNDISNIEAIHINHNLSSNSAKWEDHCKQTSKKLGIPCHVESVEIKIDGDGLESAARKARYKIFTKYLKEGDQILLGHHSNDVAETFLLRLFRGTGVDGLESLNIKRGVGDGYLVRPLINLSKEEIMMYLRENNISYINDESNDGQEQDRNYIRNNIIPSIEQRWMKASSRISNTSEFIRMKNKSYEILLEEKFKHLIDKKINLGLDIGSSTCYEFQKKSKDKNYLFSTGIDYIYEIFKFESKINSNFLSKSINLVGKNKIINSLFKKIADFGFRA